VANPKGISSNTVYALYEDHAGSVWTSGDGMDIYHPDKNIFRSYAHQPTQPNSLGQNHVWSFCEDDQGQIWIGTESGPLNIFNPTDGTFRHVTVKDQAGNAVQNIHKIIRHDGVFWLASFISGLVRYDPATGATRSYFGIHPSQLGKAGEINDILFDRDGTLWVTTYDQGLIHYNPRTEAVENFRQSPSDPTTIGSNFINCLTQDRNGNLWVGFWGGGMSMFDPKTRGFTTYRYDRKNREGLSDQVVNSIWQENDSVFWIGTHTGLDRFNVTTKSFEHFFEKDGLPNDVVYEILKDSTGHYWISTNQGLTRFDTANRRFKNFSVDDGLQSNEFNANAALQSRAGDLYFGGVQGFSVFRPGQIRTDSLPAHLVIQSFKVFEQERPVAGPIGLEHFENFVSFRFAAIEFESPEKIRYAYRLDGFDDAWIESAGDRSANYTNLDPGDYTFRVKAASADGYWSTDEAMLAFTVAPPFWRTWWFVATALVVCISIMYGLHRYRLAQSLKVERLRNKIASDLHDEVGSNLTRISIYSELLQSGASSPAQSVSYLKNISDMSREIVSTMSDIVWSIDNQNDATGALILRMRDFATEVLQARNIGMSFTVQGIDENKILDPALKQNLYLIFKESVNNIVKHAQASHVKIALLNEDNQFSLRIEDDGVGFFALGTHKGNGLRNMKRRAQAIGGTFEIEHHTGTMILVRRKAL
jgi:streptogramin lyase/two-component sensor histidine kinase